MHLAFYYVYSCEWLNQVVGNKLIQNLDWGLTKPFKFQIPQIPSFGEFKLTKLVLLIENDKCFQNLLPTLNPHYPHYHNIGTQLLHPMKSQLGLDNVTTIQISSYN